jgi:hypothetical protein
VTDSRFSRPSACEFGPKFVIAQIEFDMVRQATLQSTQFKINSMTNVVCIYF